MRKMKKSIDSLESVRKGLGTSSVQMSKDEIDSFLGYVNILHYRKRQAQELDQQPEQ